jgi:RecA/RadA recombinase
MAYICGGTQIGVMLWKGEIGMQQMGLQARLMSQALRKMSANAARAGCTLIFLNQIRHKVSCVDCFADFRFLC